MDFIKIAEEAFATKKEHPSFKSGDTITIAYRIKEGNKERIQQYRGVVIRISGHGDKKRFTVRKMSENVGVERIFPIESPFIESITVNKVGRVRRAKLYYLRALTGKKQESKKRECNLFYDSNSYKKPPVMDGFLYFIQLRFQSKRLWNIEPAILTLLEHRLNAV